MKIINFYTSEGEFGCFSNFSRDSIFLKEKLWPTTEHYFQAQKFSGTEHEDEIRYAKKPMKAARMGRERSRPLRKDWEVVKDDIMREAVMAKFTQNKGLKPVLLGTGNAQLVEHTANDCYWADGGDGSGKNMLGIILMEVRAAITSGKTCFENGGYQ
jgi:ribA/ribD-fused uncharacterized protein